ncbi:MAG: dienelactone hydrolase family protein, partial [Pyrinomonadaceae bacterium]
MHRRERSHHERDNNRITRPFEWGLSFISDHVNGDDPRDVLRSYAQGAMGRSEEFYELPEITDFTLEDDQLTWTSTIHTPSVENNIARARYFPAAPGRRSRHQGKRAVLVLPQWNAQPESHVEACRIFNMLGISALRLTLPYHEHRRPPELERADHLVSTNVGRTIQSMRQAVLDTRAAVSWLKTHGGYERVGILGTSVGSCIAFLAFAHEPGIDAGTFNHVSGYVADVVWRGLSTRHLREGFGNNVTVEELREFWTPISPVPFIKRLPRMGPRRMRFIAARYDLTFPEDLS